MFLNSQNIDQKKYYSRMLKAVGSLSRLFSESKEPYLQYRIIENLFCKSFNADNLSRTDCSADASKDGLGIGIKTFLEKNGATMQKIAEFNSEHILFRGLDDEEKVRKVSELRNERIETTKRIFGLGDMIYHCVTRKESGIIVYETKMDKVDVSNIRSIDSRQNVIGFKDGINEYSFNVTKSTLYKRFNTVERLLDLEVKVLDDPFTTIEKIFESTPSLLETSQSISDDHIFLPLYSSCEDGKTVPEKSGLNQWNAAGRQRDPNEVYIPIPSWIHIRYPDFFPERDTAFTLILPNKTQMSAKLCQDGSKALMSNPNSALGQWLLRDVLNLAERELLTYDKLRAIGLDSVVIYKNGPGIYDIDFTKTGSFEKFKGESQGIVEDDME